MANKIAFMHIAAAVNRVNAAHWSLGAEQTGRMPRRNCTLKKLKICVTIKMLLLIRRIGQCGSANRASYEILAEVTIL